MRANTDSLGDSTALVAELRAEVAQLQLLRLDDQVTLNGITEALVAHGYDVEGEDDEATWITAQLERRAPAAAPAGERLPSLGDGS
jgi:hypothetical protein